MLPSRRHVCGLPVNGYIIRLHVLKGCQVFSMWIAANDFCREQPVSGRDIACILHNWALYRIDEEIRKRII